MRNPIRLLICPLAWLCQADAVGGEIELSGQITGYFNSYLNGLADRDSVQLPTSYSGTFSWNEATRRASVVIDAPAITAVLLEQVPSITDPDQLALEADYVFGPPTDGVLTETNDAVTAELMNGSVFGGIFSLFNFQYDKVTETGQWSFSQDCIVCGFIGLHGIGGTIGAVPEPSLGILGLCGVLVYAAGCRRL